MNNEGKPYHLSRAHRVLLPCVRVLDPSSWHSLLWGVTSWPLGFQGYLISTYPGYLDSWETENTETIPLFPCVAALTRAVWCKYRAYNYSKSQRCHPHYALWGTRLHGQLPSTPRHLLRWRQQWCHLPARSICSCHDLASVGVRPFTTDLT